MNRRTAHLIHCGILAARDPERRQYAHLAPRLVREACRREMENMHWREMRDRLTAWNLRRTHAEQWDGYSMPHHAVIGIDPATITTEQTEHLRRFYA